MNVVDWLRALRVLRWAEGTGRSVAVTRATAGATHSPSSPPTRRAGRTSSPSSAHAGARPCCQCQRFKLQPRESFGSYPAEERALRLRSQTNAGHPAAATTSGLVAYLDGVPVGWCAVEPRPAYEGLLRVFRVPWVGRSEDKADEGVWAVTCTFVRAGFRRRGIGYALVRAAVEFARQHGARALEGYPMLPEPGEEITWGEIHVGTRSMFANAEFSEVSHPTPRRAVMRIDFETV